MYKYADAEHKSVKNLTTGASGIHPGVWMWEEYQQWVAGGGITEAFDTRTPEEVVADNKAENARKAQAQLDNILDTLAKNEARKSAGLPPSVNAASEESLKSHLQLVQAEADNPSEDVAWTPPLPPGVVPPAIKSLAVVIKREAGWQGNLGFRVTLKAGSPEYVPTNLALAVYSGANCTGYQYTTGAFKLNAETGEYYAVCPPGFEPGSNAVHMGLLYGAAQLSCFTLGAGVQERIVYAYEEV
jgi:hypothetical protein